MRTMTTWGGLGVGVTLVVAACSGTSVNSAGDLNEHGGAGGSGATGGSTVVPTAGRNSGGSSGSTNGAGNGGTIATAGTNGDRGGDAGAPATGGTGGDVEPTGDGGQAGDESVVECETCSVIATGDIRGLAASGEAIYWVDFGTKDTLGNYNEDGKLNVIAKPTGVAAQTVASGLHEPQALSLTANYAYIFAGEVGTGATRGIVRVPLAGGAAESLQTLPNASFTSYRVFATTPGYVYWTWGGAVYRIADTSGATMETFIAARGVTHIVGSTSVLYFEDATGIFSDDPATGTPVSFSAAGQSIDSVLTNLTIQFADSDYLYAIEEPATSQGGHVYLSRAAPVDGAWKRVAPSPQVDPGLDSTWDQLSVLGVNYFLDPIGPSGTSAIYQGALNASSNQLFSLPSYRGKVAAWTLSSSWLYVAAEGRLYEQLLTHLQ